MIETPDKFRVETARKQFPSLKLTENDRPIVFFDNPGGTQVPLSVMDAVTQYYATCNANVGGAFGTSQRTDAVVAGARQAMADLLNAPTPNEIVFGANMTTLTFHLARSIADTIRPGDEIMITNLDHDANVTPWTDLQAQGAILKVVDIDPTDCTLPLDGFRQALSERTRLVAISHASNAVGTIPDVAAITKLAHEAGALVFVDAVQYAPHGIIDVQALDCDFLACSAYKFFGPHIGILWGKTEYLERLTPHKVRPAKNTIPHRWETGTLNHEGLYGVSAAIKYLSTLTLLADPVPGNAPEAADYDEQRYRILHNAMRIIKEYEQTLARHLLAGLQQFPDITLYGITDANRLDERVPTFAFSHARHSPRQIVEHLAKRGIAAWSGNYYALRLMERLGLEASGGAVRIGLAHYNTTAEIDRLLEAMRQID